MGADDAKHFLKVIRVGGSYPQDPVCLAGDGVRLNNFGDGSHHFAHPLRRHSALAIDLDKGLYSPAQRHRFNVGGETPDHTAEPEPINASFGGRCGQPDVMPEHGEALTTMVCQSRKDLVINLVKTQYSLLGFIDYTI
jgi:hypothetical protein